MFRQSESVQTRHTVYNLMLRTVGHQEVENMSNLVRTSKLLTLPGREPETVRLSNTCVIDTLGKLLVEKTWYYIRQSMC